MLRYVDIKINKKAGKVYKTSKKNELKNILVRFLLVEGNVP